MAEKIGPGTIGRTIDYILGRNTLIGFASIMLLFIAGYATWHGMRDFIVGVSANPTQPSDGMSISNDLLVILVVVALTFLMWLCLRETFAAHRKFRDRIITFALYAFLALWSIGFGYGFWWSLISGEEATRTGLSGLQEDARDASTAVAARLDAVRSQLDGVVSWSEGQMTREESSGGSCGTASGAGRGPLYNARRSVRDRVAALRDTMSRSWLEPIQADVEQLRQSAASLGGGTVEERQRNFEAKASDIRGRARNIAARSNELGKSTAAEMKALADLVAVAPGKPGFSCHDPQLATLLNQAAEQSNQPAEIKLREAVFNEGPAGVANAVKNLWKNIGTYFAALGSYMFTSGPDSVARTVEGEPITGRDMIALLATIGIDLGLLALAILNPPLTRPGVPGDLRRNIRAAMESATSQAPGANMKWVRSHFIHHNKKSYFVIPNLYSSNSGDPVEAERALAMNRLAGVFSDLDLIEWPDKGNWFRKSELQRLKDEESVGSDTDLTDIRKKWLEKIGDSPAETAKQKDSAIREARPIRNHGLFSKAERALTIAGWSEKARADIEIFHVKDADGLTPLLEVLNDVDRHEPDTAAPKAKPA